MMDWEPTTLFDAILILARTHTRDDAETGFTFHNVRIPADCLEYTHSQYLKAWEIVREQCGMSGRPRSQGVTPLSTAPAPEDK